MTEEPGSPEDISRPGLDRSGDISNDDSGEEELVPEPDTEDDEVSEEYASSGGDPGGNGDPGPGAAGGSGDDGDDLMDMNRRTMMKGVAGVGALGVLGGLGYMAWDGGRSDPSPSPGGDNFTITHSPETETDDATPTPTSEPTVTDTPTATPTEEQYGFTIEEETVEFRTPDGVVSFPYTPEDVWYSQEGSGDVDMGVQENGDLIALNAGERIIYEFESDTHPDPELFDPDSHPLEAVYDQLESEVRELPEGAAKTISGVGEDWEENRDYKPAEVDEIFDVVTEYQQGEAMFVDYFFQLQESAETGEPVYEDEFRHLLEGEKPENQSISSFL